jgi:hypothetical protein
VRDGLIGPGRVQRVDVVEDLIADEIEHRRRTERVRDLRPCFGPVWASCGARVCAITEAA